MPFFRATIILESSLEQEDDILDELAGRRFGKNKVVEVEEVELADDFEADDDDDEDETSERDEDEDHDSPLL